MKQKYKIGDRVEVMNKECCFERNESDNRTGGGVVVKAEHFKYYVKQENSERAWWRCPKCLKPEYTYKQALLDTLSRWENVDIETFSRDPSEFGHLKNSCGLCHYHNACCSKCVLKGCTANTSTLWGRILCAYDQESPHFDSYVKELIHICRTELNKLEKERNELQKIDENSYSFFMSSENPLSVKRIEKEVRDDDNEAIGFVIHQKGLTPVLYVYTDFLARVSNNMTGRMERSKSGLTYSMRVRQVDLQVEIDHYKKRKARINAEQVKEKVTVSPIV